jgi:hypothetical protein
MADGKVQNRRRGPDALVKAIQLFSIISWLFIFVILIFFSLAKPRFQGFGKGMSAVQSGSWDTFFLDSILYVLIAQFLVCFLGLLFNANRMKRKGDQFSKSLIFFSVMSLIGAVLFGLLR